MLIASITTSISGLFFGFGLVYGILCVYFSYYLGFGLTLVFTPALVVCTIYFEKRRATALSLSLSGAGFGAFCIPQIIARLLHIYGYRGAMLVMAGVILHYCVSGIIFLNPLGHVAKKQHATVNSNDQSLAARIKSKVVILELFRDGWFMLFISSFIFNMMGSGPVTTLIIHYAEEFGVSRCRNVFQLTIIHKTIYVE